MLCLTNANAFMSAHICAQSTQSQVLAASHSIRLKCVHIWIGSENGYDFSLFDVLRMKTERKNRNSLQSFAHKCTWFCQNLAYIWHSIKQNLKSPIDWHSALICRYYIRSMCFVNGKFFKIRLLRCQSQLMLWGTRVSLLPLIHLLLCILEILSVDDIFISFCYRHFTLGLSSDLLCFL